MADLYKITYKTSDEGDSIVIPLLADEAEKLENAQELKVALGSEDSQSFDGSDAADSIGVDGVLPVKHGGTGEEDLSKVNVGSATKLETARTIITNLGSTDSASFNGTANIEPGVKGTLSVANGGTGATSLDDVTVGTASKVGTEDVGTSTEPIYIKAGVPTATDGTLDKDISGNAATTTKLKTGRALTVDLTSEDKPSFDGSADVTMGVQNTLPVSHGGTGQTDLDNVVVGVAKAIGTAVGSLMNVGGDAQPVYFANGVPVATTGVGALIDLEMDEEYKITAKLMNNAGTVIATSDVIDLPLEEMVIGGKYDKDTKTLSLKIRNKDDDGEDDSWLEIPVGDLIDGLVSTSDMASATENGLMSSTDYIKLQGIEESANNYSLPLAGSSTRGGIQIGFTQSGKNYPVELSSEQAYVNVPWTDTTYAEATTEAAGLMSAEDKARLDKMEDEANKYSLPVAANGTLGGVQIGYTQSGKNYPVELSSEKMYVNVPWTDTTYGEATGEVAGLMSADDKAKLDKIEDEANKYSLPVAKSDTLGGVKVGFSTSATDRNYAVEIDTSNNLYVNVPWTDTVPSIPGYNLTYSDKNIILQKDGATLDTVNLETAIGYASSSNNGLMKSTDYEALVAVVNEALRNENAYANAVALTMDDEYKIKVTLSNVEGEVISTSETIDLPLEELIIDGEYDAENKKIILYFNSDDNEENGDNKSPLEIPVGDLIDGLASESDLDSYAKLSAANIFTGKTQTIKAQYPRLVLANTDSAAANQLFLGAASNNIWGLGDNINSTVMWLVYANNGDFYDGTTQPIPRVAWSDTGDASTPVYFAKGIPVACTNVATKDDIAGITFPAYTMTSDSSAHTISLLKDGTVVGSAINLATVIGTASDSSDGLLEAKWYTKLAGLSIDGVTTGAMNIVVPTGYGIEGQFLRTGGDGVEPTWVYPTVTGLNGDADATGAMVYAPTGFGEEGQLLVTHGEGEEPTWVYPTISGLNGDDEASGARIYAPTSAGSSGYVLYSRGSGEPQWGEQTVRSVNGSTSTAQNIWCAESSGTSGYILCSRGSSDSPYWIQEMIASVNGSTSHGRNIYAPGASGNSGQILASRGEGQAPDFVDFDLNGSAKSTYSFYAPTSSGTSGDILVSSGSQVAPTWKAAIDAIGSASSSNDGLMTSDMYNELQDLKTKVEQLIKVGSNAATQLVFEEE